jgi:uncharacterized protein (DUF362 family)
VNASTSEEARYHVSKVGHSRDILSSINDAVEKIGGFNKYIDEGEKILVKPNYNSSDPPPASSDPLFVAGLVRLLYEAGASEVIVGESSMFLLSTDIVLKKSGLKKEVEKEGGKVAVFGEKGWVNINIGESYLWDIKLPRILGEVDKVVYSCCLKTHRFADFSISLKLGMGFTWPWTRIGWHLRRREEKIAELNKALNPALILLDARKAFITGGPFRGRVVEPNLILASDDRVSIDVEGIKIIQEYPGNNLVGNPWEYTQIKRAVELKIGALSPEDYNIVE